MTPEEKTYLSAELALGLLEGAERREVETAVTVDPEMRAAHRQWVEHFAGMMWREAGAGESPAPHVLAAIEAELFTPEAVEPDRTSWWDWLRAPENRGLVFTVATAKVLLIAWILYLFL